MKTIITYFIQGLFYTVPLGITVYVVVVSIQFLDQLVPLDVPGLGFLLMLLVITIIGFIGSKLLSSSLGNIVRRMEKFFLKLPIIKMLYTALKDLISALMGTNRTFDHAVLVTLDKENGIQKIGFMTKDDLQPMGIMGGKVSVYFPYSFGIMGDLRIVPKESVTPIQAKAAEVMKFVVSGGVVNIKDEEED